MKIEVIELSGGHWVTKVTRWFGASFVSEGGYFWGPSNIDLCVFPHRKFAELAASTYAVRRGKNANDYKVVRLEEEE